MELKSIIYPICFIFVLCISILLRMKLFPQLEIKNSDILLAILAVIIVGIATGDVKSLAFGDLKAEFRYASQKQVKKDVLPVHYLIKGDKKGLSRLQELKAKKPEGLVFMVGYQNYYPDIVCQYLEELPSLTYIVINSKDESNQKRFELLFPTKELIRENSCDSIDFVRWVAQGDITKLKEIPGTIGRDLAVEISSTKLDALDIMNQSNTQTLLVLKDGLLEGIVERSMLVSSMVADVTRSVAN